MARIRIDHVARGFPVPGGRLVALHDVAFEVADHEIVAIVGPNGSGKSTLLRLVGGLLTPDSGIVELDGEPVRGPDRRLAYVFQEPRLLPWRDTLGNVAFPLELAGWPERRRKARAAELLELVGLAEFAGARPHELSGGMRQRAAIARALALKPKVLLLDEPFSALDALTRERMNSDLVAVWSRTGTTIVLVTHSVSEAVFLADRVVVLSARPGRVAADVPVPLPRPRDVRLVDAADFSATAERIRAHLEPAPDGRGATAGSAAAA